MLTTEGWFDNEGTFEFEFYSQKLVRIWKNWYKIFCSFLLTFLNIRLLIAVHYIAKTVKGFVLDFSGIVPSVKICNMSNLILSNSNSTSHKLQKNNKILKVLALTFESNSMGF